MKLYPDVPQSVDRRSSVISPCSWIKVHNAVDGLSVLGSGVKDAGLSVQNGFGSAAGAVGGIPLVGGSLVVGGSLAGALNSAGQRSGGNVAALGEKGENRVDDLALLLGLLVFALPTLVVLVVIVPPRLRQIRQLRAASAALADTHDPERRRLLAMRAAFGLPYFTLLSYTPDPLGDLAAGRYDPLIAAALDDAGIRPQTTGRTPTNAPPSRHD